MSTPINLNRARKDRARQAAKRAADENVVRFGRSKAEKQHEQAAKQKAARDLDGHDLNGPDLNRHDLDGHRKT